MDIINNDNYAESKDAPKGIGDLNKLITDLETAISVYRITEENELIATIKVIKDVYDRMIKDGKVDRAIIKKAVSRVFKHIETILKKQGISILDAEKYPKLSKSYGNLSKIYKD